MYVVVSKISVPGKFECGFQITKSNWTNPTLNQQLKTVLLLWHRCHGNLESSFLKKCTGKVLISTINALDCLKVKESNLHTYFKTCNNSFLHRQVPLVTCKKGNVGLKFVTTKNPCIHNFVKIKLDIYKIMPLKLARNYMEISC